MRYAHPIFAGVDDWASDALDEAKEALARAIETQLPNAGAVEALYEWRWNADLSATGGTLKFEIEVFLTPLDI
jgi:hypothetical protein